MEVSDQLEVVRSRFLAALQEMARHPKSGLQHEDATALVGRLGDLRADRDAITIEMRADGLDLDHKIFLESQLLARVADTFHQPTRLVYTNSAYSGVRFEIPQPEAPRTMEFTPWGLKFNRRAIPGVRDVLVVASGKGGVGKSTVAANLAVALQNLGQRVGLLDADIYGPSAPMMLGIKEPGRVIAGSRLEPAIAHGVKCMSFGFFSDALNPVMWRGPLLAKTVRQFLYDVVWGELDTLIVDLPPGTGDVQLSLIELLPIHGALIVTTPQDIALIDAHKALSMFETLGVTVVGVVENMAIFVCPQCGHHEHVFGDGALRDFAAQRRVEIAGRIPLAAPIRAAADAGLPISADSESPYGMVFRDLAQKVARSLMQKGQ